MRRPFALAAFLLVVPALLPSCGGGGSSTHYIQFTSVTPEESTAGTWRTWLVADVDAMVPAAPPTPLSQQTADELTDLNARAAARTPSITLNVDTWNKGACKDWNELQRALIVSRKPPPPQAARGFALASTAMYDSMVVAFRTKYLYLRARPNALPGGPVIYGPQEDSPSYVSLRAAISAAAHDVLNAFFPLDTAAIDANLAAAVEADLDSGTQFQSDVDAGLSIGHAVAALALARKATDHGDDVQPVYSVVGGGQATGHWSFGPPTEAQTNNPVLPGWGIVQTWLLPDGSAVRPPAPPVYGSTEWNFFRDDVLNVNLTLTVARKAIADFWSDGGGTVTPPGHWNQIAVDEAFLRGWSDVRVSRMLALLGVAQHDAFVACWDCKYAFNTVRPVMDIRATVGGQSAWLPYITPTPHFPSYPSGHSTTSGAASEVLAFMFPDKAIDYSLMAQEAKDSRLYGGIHYRFDNDTGFSMGALVGTLATDVGANDGAGANP